MSEAAAQGFRLLPETIMITSGGTGFGLLTGSGEMVAVMERGPRVTARYEYFLIATALTSTLQEEITKATEAGFMIVGLSGGRENFEHVALMERVVP